MNATSTHSIERMTPQTIDEEDRRALEAYSRGTMSALELRRRLRDATYGEVLALLRREKLPLPRAPIEGREAQIARARSWLFPKDGL